MIDYGAIDDAVINQIAGASAGAFLSVATLDHEEQLFEGTPRPPCAFTLIGESHYDEPAGATRYQDGRLDVLVYVKARNARGDGAARKADGGAYDLISEVKRALVGFEPVTCAPLHLVSVAPRYITRNIAVYKLTFRTTFEEEF